MIRYFAIAFALLYSGLSCAQETDSFPLHFSPIERTESIVARELVREHYPGVAVAVWHADTLTWSKGFGFASIEDSLAVDPSRSLFRIGSVSKTLTAAGLARLYERGQIDLDETVQKYVPYFPEKQWPVTTKQVASHIAGIRHYLGLEFLSNVHYNSVEEAIGVFANDTLLFEPGSKFHYSSFGWNLISGIMEGASRRPFLEYMDAEIFTPAGMHNTYPDDILLKDLPRVTFYQKQGNGNVICLPVDNSVKWAGGGFLSTAEDLIRFGIAILDNRLTRQETTRYFQTPAVLNDGHQTNYGLGWATHEDKKGRRWAGHSGGSVGGSSMFLLYPKERLIIVTLINQSQANAQDLAFTIADQFLK